MDILKYKTKEFRDFQTYLKELTEHFGYKGERSGNSARDLYGHKITWFETNEVGEVIKVTVENPETNQKCSITSEQNGDLSVEGHDDKLKYGLGYDTKGRLDRHWFDDGRRSQTIEYRDGKQAYKWNTIYDADRNVVSEDRTDFFDGGRRTRVIDYSEGKVTRIRNEYVSENENKSADLFVGEGGKALLRVDEFDEGGKLKKAIIREVPCKPDDLEKHSYDNLLFGGIEGQKPLWAATRDANGTFVFYDGNNMPTDIVAKGEDGKKHRHSLKEHFKTGSGKSVQVRARGRS